MLENQTQKGNCESRNGIGNGMKSEQNELPLINNTWATELRRMEQSAEKDVIVDLTGIAGSSDFIDLTLDCEEKTDTKNLQT